VKIKKTTFLQLLHLVFFHQIYILAGLFLCCLGEGLLNIFDCTNFIVQVIRLVLLALAYLSVPLTMHPREDF
jgi:hypothetical protein